MTQRLELNFHWDESRPRVLVVGCSDGRLQEATDEFLSRALGIRRYDRLYVPGGGGALATSGTSLLRPHQFRHECAFLVEAHSVQHVIVLFHGPAANGPPEAVCADYRQRSPLASAAWIRTRQDRDSHELLTRRLEFAGNAHLSMYRMEITASRGVEVSTIHQEEPGDVQPRALPSEPEALPSR